MTQIMKDDQLLSSLGRGDAPPPDDLVAVMLAAWRDAVVRGVGGERQQRAAVVELLPRRARAGRRWRWVAAAAAVAAVAGAGAVAVDHARPGSPLFAATRVVFPGDAARREAERAVDEAYAAAGAGAYGQAWPLTYAAEDRIRAVPDGPDADDLRRRIAALRQSPGMVAALRQQTASRPAGTPGGAPPPVRSPGPAGSSAPPPAGPAPSVPVPVAPGPAVVPSPTPAGPNPTPTASAPGVPAPGPVGGVVGDVVDGLGGVVCGLLPCVTTPPPGPSPTGPGGQ